MRELENGEEVVDLLRHRVLSQDDAWRAYGEALWASDKIGLSETARRTVLGWVGKLSLLLGKREAEIVATLREAVLPVFEDWTKRDVEAVLAWLGESEQAEFLQRLKALAVERWNYSPALLRNGQRPHSVFVLGVPDKENTVFGGNNGLEVISTGDPERILLARLAIGLPASALTAWDRYRQAAERNKDHPLHNIPGFKAKLNEGKGGGGTQNERRNGQKETKLIELEAV